MGTLYHIILFLLGLVGKQKGHVHRLAMVIQALSNASEILLLAEQMQAGDIDSDFKEKIKKCITDKYGETNTIMINTNTTSRSITLVKYFMQHKKFLSGYNISGVGVLPVSSQLSKKILLYPGKTVPCNTITKNTRYTADQVKQEMKQLANVGLGIFHKVNIEDLGMEKTREITTKLANYAIDFKEFSEEYENSENGHPAKRAKVLTTQNTNE